MPSPEHLERASAWYASGYRIVSDLHTHVYFQVFSPAKVIFAGVGVHLLVRILILNTFLLAIVTSRCQAAKDVRAIRDNLIDIFERIEHFFRRLEVYTEVTPTTEMMDIIMTIMVEVLAILGIVTKDIKQGRTSELFV